MLEFTKISDLLDPKHSLSLYRVTIQSRVITKLLLKLCAGQTFTRFLNWAGGSITTFKYKQTAKQALKPLLIHTFFQEKHSNTA